LKQDFPQEEKAKLEQIARIEPFLSDCTLLFTLMAADRTHSIGAVAERWEQFDRNADRLPSLAQQLTGYANLRAIKGSEAARRLVHLQQVANANDIEQQIRGLANYHGRVMQSRGQPAWLSIAHDGKIKMNARTMPRPKPTDWPPGAWYNNYYLPQFKSLVMGLQGGGA
jgi:hypothetical protein